MSIPFKSSPETVENDRLTVLAIIETIVAFGLWLLMANAYWRTEVTTWKIVFSYVLSSSLIGPALLMRTNWSTNLGLRLYGQVLSLVQNVGQWRDFPSPHKLHRELRLAAAFLFFLCVIPILLVLARTVAIAYNVVRHPIDSILAIPNNWVRTVFVLDIFSLPEVVVGLQLSGMDKMYDPIELFKNISYHLNTRFAGRSRAFRLLYRWGTALQCSLLIIPALFLRLGVKASCIAWLPILYSARSYSPTRKTLDEQLDEIRTDTFELIKRGFAVFHFGFATLHTLTVFAIQQMALTVSLSGIFLIFAAAVDIEFEWAALFQLTPSRILEIRPWGCLAISNAIITFCLFRVAEKAARHDRLGRPRQISHEYLSFLLITRSAIGYVLVLHALDKILPKIIHIQLPLGVRILW